MSLLEELGKVAGAIAAEQGLTKLDPGANFLEKAAAAVAGFEATKIAEEKIGEAVDDYQDKDDNSEEADTDNTDNDDQDNESQDNESQDSDVQDQEQDSDQDSQDNDDDNN